MRTHLARCLGRRGTFLTLVGILWVMQAVAIAQAPRTLEPGAETLFHEQLPTPLRCALWAGTGLIAMAYAWRRSPGQDTPGFIALVIMPLERAVSFLYGFGLYLVPGPGGYPRGLIGGTVWLAVSAAVILIAGWPEPDGYAPPRKSKR